MTNLKKDVQFLTRGESLAGAASTGVSLHCHTLHSREILDFVPYYAERIPVASYFWRRTVRRHEKLFGAAPDFKTGYWEPPLTGPDVIASEQERIGSLGLTGIVSITDHDSIDANMEIRDAGQQSDLPISMEWTVPFRNAFFHVGVHNLPHDEARDICRELLDYTYATGVPDEKRLKELLKMLGENREVLIVLNHPIWDIEMIGQQAHEQALDQFLRRFSRRIHAIEINGFRSWAENQTAIELAETVGLPIISGGDRHCCQNNTMINVTGAASFAEFVDEIRIERRSRIAVMPEYHLPLPSRQLASISQILADFEHFPVERQLWSDRVHLDSQDGRGLITLTEHWGGRRPYWTRIALGAIRFLGHPLMRPIIGMTVGDTDIGRDDRTNNVTGTTALSPIAAERLNPESV